MSNRPEPKLAKAIYLYEKGKITLEELVEVMDLFNFQTKEDPLKGFTGSLPFHLNREKP